MQRDFISYGSSRLSYLRWGTGEKLLVGFHGYGESAASFSFLEAELGREYSFLAIDLPFHGETDWKDGLFLDPAGLLQVIETITRDWPGSRGPWTFLGYSMGGRAALQLLELIPQKVERLVLVAPDGLKVNGWYWLATQTILGNRLFRWTMKYPGWFFSLLRVGNGLRIVNRSVFKFTSYYIGDSKARQELYERWTTMRGFRPDLDKIRTGLATHGISVRLLYGRFDRIIRWETGDRFCRSVGSACQLDILQAGHQLLQAKHTDALVKLFSE